MSPLTHIIVQGQLDSNAVEHTPAGSIVKVEICEMELRLCFVVEDSGTGFSQAALAHGTEAFKQYKEKRGKSLISPFIEIVRSVCYNDSSIVRFAQMNGGWQ